MEADQAVYQDAPEGTMQTESESGRGKKNAFGQPIVSIKPEQKKQKLAVPRIFSQTSTIIVLLTIMGKSIVIAVVGIWAPPQSEAQKPMVTLRQ
jgi:hypothetical protein